MFPIRNRGQCLFINKQLYKFFCSKSLNKCEEVRIPVPWGHVAGKWWGPTDKRPIVCLHAWQESCSSFDPLLELLSTKSSYLAIDLPGHGRSSPFPSGLIYHHLDYALTLRRIQNYFEWPKLSLMAHSMGSFPSFLYTTLFPEEVDLLIFLDCLKPFSYEPGSVGQKLALTYDQFLHYEALKKSETPSPLYTYKEILDKFYQIKNGSINSKDSIDYNKCKYVVDRIIQKSDHSDKYFYTRDIILKAGTVLHMQHSDIREYSKQIKCPFISLKATRSSYYEDSKYVYDIIGVMKAHNPDFSYIYVEGTHHFFVNEPEKVTGLIYKFLEKYDTQDRSKGGIRNDIFIEEL